MGGWREGAFWNFKNPGVLLVSWELFFSVVSKKRRGEQHSVLSNTICAFFEDSFSFVLPKENHLVTTKKRIFCRFHFLPSLFSRFLEGPCRKVFKKEMLKNFECTEWPKSKDSLQSFQTNLFSKHFRRSKKYELGSSPRARIIHFLPAQNAKLCHFSHSQGILKNETSARRWQ